MYSDFIYVERLRPYLKIKATQYLRSTCYVLGPRLETIDTTGNPQGKLYFACTGLRLRGRESSHPGVTE